MKFITVLTMLATTALALPAVSHPVVRETPLEVRNLLEARQATCLCVEGEWCCTFSCTVDPSCG